MNDLNNMTTSNNQEIDKKKNEPTTSGENNVWAMFDRIAHRYDLLNRILSMRQDVIWRKKMARYIPADTPVKILDLATGTGDQLIFLAKRRRNISSGIGVDMAEKMIEIGNEKIREKGLESRFELQKGNATDLPFDNDTFDVATISFGIRNVNDVERSLSEMRRILKPGGKALILEFSIPENRVIRSLYMLYFRHVLPRIGGLISGDSQAYRYLNQTVETFPYGKAFCDLMENAGFTSVEARPLSFGIASVYKGEK